MEVDTTVVVVDECEGGMEDVVIIPPSGELVAVVAELIRNDRVNV